MAIKNEYAYYYDSKEISDSYLLNMEPLFSHDIFSKNITNLDDTFNEMNITSENSSMSFEQSSLPIDMQFNAGHVVSISVYSVLFVLSALGNITVLTAILRRKRTRAFFSRIDLLLLHLAVSDLMVTFFMMPLEIGWAATVEWKAGDWMCRIMAFFRIFGLYLSGFVLVCLAIDRYLAVRYPMQGLASTKRAKWMVISAWLLSSLCSFPQILIFHVERHPTYTWYKQCVTYNSFPKPEYELLYNIFVMVLMYALPFILLVVLYGSIAVELWKMGHSSRTAFGLPDGLRRSGTDNIERAKVKSIQMTFVITAAFLICWTPYYVMCVWYWTDPQTAKTVDQRIQKGLFLFASTNSTVNPIVYGIFNMKSIFGRRNTNQPVELSTSLTNRSNPITQACIYRGSALRGAQLLNNLDSVDVQVQSQRNGYAGKPTAVVTLTKQVNQHGLHQQSDLLLDNKTMITSKNLSDKNTNCNYSNCYSKESLC